MKLKFWRKKEKVMKGAWRYKKDGITKQYL